MESSYNCSQLTKWRGLDIQESKKELQGGCLGGMQGGMGRVFKTNAIQVGNVRKVKFWTDTCMRDFYLDESFAELWNLVEKSDVTVANLYNGDQLEPSWNLGFVRGFHHWEPEDVNNLYISLENQKLNTTMKDKLLWKPESSGTFSVNPIT